MEQSFPLYILLVGCIIVFAIFFRFWLEKLRIPALIGYFILGFIVRLVDMRWSFLKNTGYEILEFLANIGIIVLLFRVGLESKLGRLIKWLPKAIIIWMSDILVSGILGFTVSYFLLNWTLLHSLFIAVAFSVTSVGVSIAVWQEANAVDTPYGEVVLDVAELDDISGIILMGVLFSVAPLLHNTTQISILPLAAREFFIFILKIILFSALCIFFSKYIERHITKFLNRLHSGESTMLVVWGMGLIVAAIAGLIGFSIAIGAFFAGLIFSRDPEAVKINISFESMYNLFVPFFFLGIGLNIDHTVLRTALIPASILLFAAVIGKFVGAGLPSLFILGKYGAVMLGVSMIPRAEIALIIMQRGLRLGEWAVSPHIFANMVLISGSTAVLVPLLLRPLLKTKFPIQLK